MEWDMNKNGMQAAQTNRKYRLTKEERMRFILDDDLQRMEYEYWGRMQRTQKQIMIMWLIIVFLLFVHAAAMLVGFISNNDVEKTAISVPQSEVLISPSE